MSNSEKITTFANVIELERHIEILLLSNDCVIVPDFGGFMAHHVDARYDDRDNMFLPPLRTIGFNQQLKMNDSLLALSYVEAYDISYPEALNRIADEVNELRQSLENNGKYELNDLGTLSLNEDGNISFEPCEAGILTPEFYGLSGFDMPTLAQVSAANHLSLEKQDSLIAEKEEKTQLAVGSTGSNRVFVDEDDEESKGAEFVSIKKSWLRNVAAACIAIIAFFALSTPLGTPTVQKSQIDTGMLNRIMPKEMTTHQPTHELVLSNNTKAEEAVEGTTDKKSDTGIAEDKEIEGPTSSYYSIVLASRITKHNAANYAETLQSKGFKDARVLITNNNVKVIYGNYETESEAYAALNRLHNNEAFNDGWITKVKE